MTDKAIQRAFPFGNMAKEAGLTALVVFGLMATMIGLHVENVVGGLTLKSRVGAVVVATVLAFVLRCILIVMREGRPLQATVVAGIGATVLMAAKILKIDFLIPFHEPFVDWVLALFLAGIALGGLFRIYKRRKEPGKHADPAKKINRMLRKIGPAILVGAILMPVFAYLPDIPLVPKVDRRLLDMATLVLIYVMLGWGLNIVVGLAGLLDLGYVAFYAVGAYSYALVATHYDISFWICLPFAGAMAAAFGILLGFPVLRLRGDYLAIVTLGFGEIIRIVLNNWAEVTQGPDGIPGIPRPTFFGLEFGPYASDGGQTFHEFFGLTYAPIDRLVFMYYLILILALVTNYFTLRIRRLPIGRAWEALREDEIACRSLGINPTNTKLTAFAIGAMFAGLAGSFFATRQGHIDPKSFTFIESAIILAIVVLGGMGSQFGIVLAAILLAGLPEFFRELQQYRMLTFGGAMVLVMIWKPSGLLAFREPTIRLNDDDKPP